MQANLEQVAALVGSEAVEEIFEADAAGGGNVVLKKEATFESGRCRWLDGRLHLEFSTPGAVFEATPTALGLPHDWEPFGRLHVDVASAAPDVVLEVAVSGARCRLEQAASVPAGSTSIRVSLDLTDLALAAGIRELYHPSTVRLSAHGDGSGPVELDVLALHLERRDGPPPAVVDGFGQRRSTSWPTKVAHVDEFRRHREQETPTLTPDDRPWPADAFGGWTGGPRFDAGDFFRVEQDDGGRWWFVTPEGHPFWSIGTTCVRLGDVTPFAGREHLFEQMPPSAGEHAAARRTDRAGREGLSFYAWNILHKYGSVEAWRDRVIDRFRTWGFNSFGNWCEEPFLEQRRIPHFRWGSSRAGVHDNVTQAARGFADVWDPAWEQYLDRHFAELTADCRDNPWLVGYFVDNESPWRNMRLLSAPPQAHLRSAWREHCRGCFTSLDGLNDAFGSRLGDWDAVAAMTDEQVPAEGPGREAMNAFEGLYADRYASRIRHFLKKHDPNHLYLGCRFTNYAPHDAIVAGVGRHVDVLTVNCYSLFPPRDRYEAWHTASGGKPMLIGEFHFPQRGPRQLPPLYRSYDPHERFEIYSDYVRQWAAMPWSLGCHWFQHADQPITGRASNGENQPIGFVDITDQPHEELLRALAAVAPALWQIHAESA